MFDQKNSQSVSTAENTSPSNTHGRLSRIASYIFFALVGLSPVFFIPSSFYSLEFAKTSFLFVGIVAIAIIQLVSAFRAKSTTCLPKSVQIVVGTLAGSVIASALYSPTFMKSFFGQGYELNTAHFLLVIILTAMIAYRVARIDIKNTLIIYSSVIGSFLVVLAYQLLRIVSGGEGFSFGTFGSITSTPVGSWVDFGIFSALVALLGLVTIKFLNLNKKMRIIAWAITILSLLPILIVNNTAVWASLAIVLIAMTAYLYENGGVTSGTIVARIRQGVVWIFGIPLILIVLYAFQGDVVSNKLNESLGTGYAEVGLTWRSTLDVVVGSIKASPLLGIGENRFVQAYTTFKPIGINSTDLWSLEFTRGFSWLSTFAATQGIIGFAAWVLLFILLARMGHKAFRTFPDQPVNKYMVASSYVASAFLWLMTILYAPSHVILFMAAVFTGIFIASLVQTGAMREYTVDFSKWWVKSAFVLCGLALVVWAVFGIGKIIGMSYFGAGVKHMTLENKIDEADASFDRALALDSSNIYWQAKAEIALARIQNLASTINSQTSASTTAAAAVTAGELANMALTYSEKAIAYDPYNYYGYISKARIAEAGAALKMDKAGDVALQSYQQAISLNPTNPEIYLSLARFLASQGLYDESLQAIGASLNIKSNYIDAIFLLSQVQATKGDLKNAIVSAKVATQINPNSPLLHFQLGLLEYNNASYSDAANSLNKAVEINPEYANARYFLGLAYARMGENSKSISEFQKLAETNPDNQEVQNILSSLMAGRNIFRSTEIDEAEKSSKLPIDQE